MTGLHLLQRLELGASADAGLSELRRLAAELGAEPPARSTMIDLIALGITRLAWRDGPMEEWHCMGLFWPSELMRANVAMTRHIREWLDERLPACWWGLRSNTGDFRSTGFLPDVVFGRDLGIVRFRLPDGRTVVDAVGSRERVVSLSDHVRACGDRWKRLACWFGLSTVLLMLACYGAWMCARWWLHPVWPLLVDEFMVRRMGMGYRSTSRRVSSDDVRAGLLAGPDLLEAGLARECWAALAGIALADLGFRHSARRPKFLCLLDPRYSLTGYGDVRSDMMCGGHGPDVAPPVSLMGGRR